MIVTILNFSMLIGFLIGVVYGSIKASQSVKHKAIFNVTLNSMVAFLVSRLFFMVFNISGGDVNEFSVGVLGQLSAYLFLVLANRTYLPFEDKKTGFSLKAMPILIIPLACYGYSFVDVQTVGDIVCSIIYMCSTCFAMYFSFENILLSRSNVHYKNLRAYFISVLIITITSSLETAVFVINNDLAFTIVCIVLTAIVVVDSIVMLPLLNRGLKKDAC